MGLVYGPTIWDKTLQQYNRNNDNPVADKAVRERIDAIGKMPYGIARPYLLKIRHQFGPFKIDIAPATRRYASLLLAKIDARKIKPAIDKDFACRILHDLETLKRNVSTLGNGQNIATVDNKSVLLLMSALNMTGRFDGKNGQNIDRKAVLRALHIIEFDYGIKSFGKNIYGSQVLEKLLNELSVYRK